MRIIDVFDLLFDTMPIANTHSIIDFLGQSTLFKNLNYTELTQIINCMEQQVLKQGEYLFQAGEPYKKCVYILQQGKIQLKQDTGQIFTLIPGELLGLANALDTSPYVSTAMALTPVVLLVVPAQQLRDVELSCPILFNELNRFIAHYIRHRVPHRQVTSRTLTLPARVVMKSPLAVCSPEATLAEAHKMMRSRKIGSLGIVNQTGHLLGLLTFANIADAAYVAGKTPETKIIDIIEQSHTVPPETPLWQVEEYQHTQGVKYVVVTEEQKPLGIISQTDILHNLIAHQGIIFAEILSATTFLELKAHYKRISSVAHEARENNHRASMAARNISEFHLALQRRCVELVLQEMEADGSGSAPTNYALFIMGSGSRKEMMLNPDQDNGIIIADNARLDIDHNKRWFESFCNRVNYYLDEIGYELCQGEIMARNHMFHKTLRQWKQQLSHIIHHPTPKAARWANIFLDFDLLYGDNELITSLRKFIYEELKERPQLLRMMVQDDAEGQPAVGFFNRLITEKDGEGRAKVDIKRNGLRIIADMARIYALNNGIEARNTLDRLVALVHQGVLSATFMRSICVAFEELLDLLLEHQLTQLKEQQTPDKLIEPKSLSPLHQESLRMAMRAIKESQEKLQTEFDTILF